MSLKKNIIFNFLMSSLIIAVLAVASYVNFIEIRKDIRLADNLRSESLQLRRHEKNYFLYMNAAEIQDVHIYLKELRDIIREGSQIDGSGKLQELESVITEYEGRFKKIETFVTEFHREFDALKASHPDHAVFSPLIESTFLEQPSVNARLLEELFSVPAGAPIISHLRDLDNETRALRKNGEEIIIISRELDRSAWKKVEHAIGVLQTATLVLLPLFFIVGLITLFLISHSVVGRLRELTEAVRKTGKGNFASLAVSEKRDEVGLLTSAFVAMEHDLVLREEELKKKNEELLRNRKLASIGTLASGVAHELNNPLNNIYISAQILEKEAEDARSPRVKEIMEDIVGQTRRVKRIVGDLLEFARGREPRRTEIELNDLLGRAFRLAGVTAETGDIKFGLDTDPGGVLVSADPEQLERVFINLFGNAIDAMSGLGDLKVAVRRREDAVTIKVSDSGRGMSAEAVEKIFEPFYTTKDKGTGLGLAIVFNIITRHGGNIKVESSEGGGTSFTITLPPGENVNGS
jgi:two-component system, NtrC family, sensor kinase